MKCFLVLMMLILTVQGCASGIGPAALPDREALLPDNRVEDMAGVPMALLADSVDEKAGFACWAWEETEALPKLLVVEFHFPPQDCDGLYEDAMQGSEPISTLDGTQACYDERALHLRAGGFYVRIAALGFANEKEVLTGLAAEIAGALQPPE